MNYTEWESKASELNPVDTKALFESNLGISIVDIIRLVLDFFLAMHHDHKILKYNARNADLISPIFQKTNYSLR